MQFVIYIGAALVIGLLIGFIALSIMWLRKTMLHNVRSHTLNLLSVYDDLLEEKSNELSEIKKEEARIKEEESAALAEKQESFAVPAEVKTGVDPSALLSVADRAAEASYRDGSIGATYHRIRKNFSYQVEELMPSVAAQPYQAQGPASKLLQELDYETVYALSTLTEKEQLRVLAESISTEGLVLLGKYKQNHSKFAIFDFYDYLKSKAAEEPKAAKLYISEGAVPQSERIPQNVNIAVDGDICEGFQVEMGGKLYDYCIKTKELS